MAPRAMGTASIAFGLVNIPVKLFSAANPKAAISFKMLSKEGHRLKQQYVDPENGDAVVPRSEMVKGYEHGKDKFLLFEPEELADLQEKATQEIEITEFVREDQVPRVYFDKTYYLGPDKGGDRAYRLLSEAMKQTGRVGLAKYRARGKQYLVMVAPAGDALALHQLHYHDEVVDVAEIPTGDALPKEEEVAMATMLIEQRASDVFSPERYEDEVRMRTLALIERKLAGQVLTEAPAPAPASSEVVDLMAALKASLAKKQSEASAEEKETEDPASRAG